MNKTFIIGFSAVIAFFVMSGCSATQSAIKTADPYIIYDHAVELYDSEQWGKALQLFQMVEPYLASTSMEDTLQFYSARCQFKRGDYENAIASFDEFRRRYGRSVFLEDAEGMYTLSHYYSAPPTTRDQTLSRVAIIAIEEFLSRYPESKQHDTFVEIREELEGRLHEKSFLNAYTYFKIGRYKSAIIAFKNALREYPESARREDISYYIVASAYHLSANSIESKKEDRFLQMKDSYYTFIAEFPESKHRSDVDDMLRKADVYLDKRRETRAAEEEGEELSVDADEQKPQ